MITEVHVVGVLVVTGRAKPLVVTAVDAHVSKRRGNSHHHGGEEGMERKEEERIEGKTEKQK